MLDGVQRNGLMGRMLKNFGLSADLSGSMVVYPIASACYPKAIKRDEDGILEPKISVDRIRHLTEMCVDYGSGSLDDLYEEIWGVRGFSGYLEKFVNQLEP